MSVFTVSQINRYIGFKLKEDKNIQNIMVRGEISNFTNHYKTGHLYFTLKDEQCGIKAVMFASSAARLKFTPEDGMSVIISGSVSVYERDGIYQLYVNDIIPDGAGSAAAALEQLKKKLSKAGIFDTSHKRKLPSMPKKIGAVTAQGGAAVRDIINVISRRYPIGELVIINALVQGENAPDSICRGIQRAEELGCDTVIVGRGGGSAEDLSAFNTEKVAYAIYNCTVPVISAVGHETDFTIADLAADLRAPTPSAAAELAVPDREQLLKTVEFYENKLSGNVLSIIDGKTSRLISLNSRLSNSSPENRLKLNAEKLSGIENRLKNAVANKFERCNSELNQKIVKLDSLSPLKVMARGYSLVYRDGKLLNTSENLNTGDEISIRFGTGSVTAEIKEIIGGSASEPTPAF